MGFFEGSELFFSNLLNRKKFNEHYNQEKRLTIFKKGLVKAKFKLSFKKVEKIVDSSVCNRLLLLFSIS